MTRCSYCDRPAIFMRWCRVHFLQADLTLYIRANGRNNWQFKGPRRIQLLKAFVRTKGDTCLHCLNAIDIYEEDLYYRPSIGHVVPVSRGGSNLCENLHLAHWICNTRAGLSLARSTRKETYV